MLPRRWGRNRYDDRICGDPFCVGRSSVDPATVDPGADPDDPTVPVFPPPVSLFSSSRPSVTCSLNLDYVHCAGDSQIPRSSVGSALKLPGEIGVSNVQRMELYNGKSGGASLGVHEAIIDKKMARRRSDDARPRKTDPVKPVSSWRSPVS